MSEETQKICNLQRVYAKDISFEAPGAPEAFLHQWQPKVKVQLSNGHNPLGEEGEHEVTVTVTVTASHEDKTIYIAEATQVGIFIIKGMEGEELNYTLGAYCPGIIFPFVRDTIAAVIMRGSFPQFLIQPINFDALYYDARKQNEQQGSNEGGSADQTH